MCNAKREKNNSPRPRAHKFKLRGRTREIFSRAKDVNLSLLLVASLVFAIIPLTSYSYLEYVFMTAMGFIIFAASWDLLFSYSGQLTLGHALQYGLGAFLFAILAFQNRIPIIPAIILGALGSCALGAIFGFTTLRLSPVYQGTALLLLSEVLFYLTTKLYGEEGLSFFSNYVANHDFLYYVGIAIFIPSMLSLYFLETSRWRIKFKAVKGDPLAAESMGINVNKYKIIVMTISSLMAGVSGAYYSFVYEHVGANVFSVANSFVVIAIVVIGGIGNIGGVIIGALIVIVVQTVFPIWFSNSAIVALIYGALVIIVLRVIPRGVAGTALSFIQKKLIPKK
ncbi:MAG: branched-chain amino acid ABC transporter permease [Nitrososphaerota archaeon]|nr:branched-chain amino acid ABC transporter permease [Nitrososphaerota archaeon]